MEDEIIYQALEAYGILLLYFCGAFVIAYGLVYLLGGKRMREDMRRDW